MAACFMETETVAIYWPWPQLWSTALAAMFQLWICTTAIAFYCPWRQLQCDNFSTANCHNYNEAMATDSYSTVAMRFVHLDGM